MGPSRNCWNGTTSALQPEESTSKGDESFMCVQSIKVPIRKKSGNLFNDPRIYDYTFLISFENSAKILSKIFDESSESSDVSSITFP